MTAPVLFNNAVDGDVFVNITAIGATGGVFATLRTAVSDRLTLMLNVLQDPREGKPTEAQQSVGMQNLAVDFIQHMHPTALNQLVNTLIVLRTHVNNAT